MLSPDQVAQFERDGFLVLPDVVGPEAIASLRERAVELVDEWEPTTERTVFTTEQQERVSNREFLSSGDTIWCFFEEEAFGPDGTLTQPKELSINKIGHAMHDLDPVFERFTYTPELAAIAADIGMPVSDGMMVNCSTEAGSTRVITRAARPMACAGFPSLRPNMT